MLKMKKDSTERDFICYFYVELIRFLFQSDPLNKQDNSHQTPFSHAK